MENTRKLTPAQWNREINHATRIGARPTRWQKIRAYARYLAI